MDSDDDDNPAVPPGLAATFEAMAESAIAQRGRAPLKASGGRLRPIKLLSADGVVVGVQTTAEVLKELLRREGVEASVEGKRPMVIPCAECGMPQRVPSVGRISAYCKTCRPTTCADCGGPKSVPSSKRCRVCHLRSDKSGQRSEHPPSPWTMDSIIERAETGESPIEWMIRKVDERKAAKKAGDPNA